MIIEPALAAIANISKDKLLAMGASYLANPQNRRQLLSNSRSSLRNVENALLKAANIGNKLGLYGGNKLASIGGAVATKFNALDEFLTNLADVDKTISSYFVNF